MTCDWCGEEEQTCWCQSVSESFKNGETENDYEEAEVTP